MRSPIDSNRAIDLASRFAVINADRRASVQKAKVINMLAVEGEDQVMLRVTVAEVQRSALKQLGINLGAQFTSGNLAMNLLTENTLPLDGGCRSRRAAGRRHRCCGRRSGGCTTAGVAVQLQHAASGGRARSATPVQRRL